MLERRVGLGPKIEDGMPRAKVFLQVEEFRN